MALQRPTCTGVRLRSTSDAHVIFHAVSLGILPMVTRRLDTEERRSIVPGAVFVWEERSPNTEATGLGIERWTDSIKWGPSRVRDDFLLYNEKEVDMNLEPFGPSKAFRSPSPSGRTWGDPADRLVKQTYSVFVERSTGRRKWHLIAYFTQESLDYLRTIRDIPQLASLRVPEGMYRKARLAKGRSREDYMFDRQPSPIAPYGDPHTPLPEIVSPPTPSSPSESPVTYSMPPISALTPPGWHEQMPARVVNHTPRLSFPSPNLQKGTTLLAPLSYLENVPHTRRHPMDEKALSSFHARLA
ncbi:hypothetical protein JAAARDRAFT_71140 [Jaapia argillacea MUCL 33604]|uniref:cAMP-independent regulatory protein pac2 n=1 Tax=Jaapia argillacea MUCL 33604 TaxID=933084 RepID=A0A067PLT4_9AGAM|nr:hypothetical protein JAAARDRAFT_71140 [Jaapia argillacea MUCL 33604]